MDRAGEAPLELPGEELADFLLFALDHATDCVVPRGGPLVPFVMLVQPGGRALHRFAGEMAQAQEFARAWIRQQEAVRMACVAWDGYLTLDGVRTDAVFVDGCDDSGDLGYLFVQRYGRVGRIRRTMATIGNPGLSGRSERLFDV
ncbi:hypothetical protein CLV92_104154 [Kineococcus xinjiangensis]|uniref:Uncharacterized protein n=1 Tax=Kineococcus xinjiangensis TaxID=512762 RepID=A0A2S6ISV5_9ACTN|nr:hypothetical protein [Kineococcus xinjiangensis]PPK97333.1 hypothetical protein CLV92_104154 [Kineococcus xinjiangensis]